MPIDKLSELVRPELTLNRTISLYRYSRQDRGDTITLDPKIAAKNKNYYSSRDYNASSVPRIWFYVDLKKTEASIRSPYLYMMKADGSKILNLKDAFEMYQRDIDDLRINYPKSYLAIKKSENSYGNIDYNKLFKNIKKEGFEGAYYETGGIPMVVMFVVCVVKKVKTKNSIRI
jgi:hypothetical protein